MSVEYMTGTKTSELKSWLDDYLKVGELGDSLKQAANPSLPDNLSTKAQKVVKEEGWEHYDGITPRNAPNRLTKNYFNDVANYGAAENHAKDSQRLSARLAANRFKSKLDDIVADLPEEGLIGILGDEESAKIIGSHAPKDHKDWVKQYGSYMGLLQLAEKAKRGEISDQERIRLREPMRRKRAEQAKAVIKGQGINDSLFIEVAGEIVAEDVEREFVLNRDSYVKVIGELVKDELMELRKYESDKKQNVRTYVGGALKNLVKDAKGFEAGADIARRIALYK